MDKRTWQTLAVLGVVFVGMLALSSVAADYGDTDLTPTQALVTTTPTAPAEPVPGTSTEEPDPDADPDAEPATLPHGGPRIFGDGRFLVAYYGSANTGALGVLGETSPDRMVSRLREAAAPFERPGSEVQIVFELIVTVADAAPGKANPPRSSR